MEANSFENETLIDFMSNKQRVELRSIFPEQEEHDGGS